MNHSKSNVRLCMSFSGECLFYLPEVSVQPKIVKIIILLGGHRKNHGPKNRGKNGSFSFIDFLPLLCGSTASAHRSGHLHLWVVVESSRQAWMAGFSSKEW